MGSGRKKTMHGSWSSTWEEGTFDVSILELYDTILEVHAVAGDNFLGGEDFTAVLEKMFYDAHPQLNRFTLSGKTQQHIRRQAELCKIGFGENRTSEMRCNIEGKRVCISG